MSLCKYFERGGEIFSQEITPSQQPSDMKSSPDYCDHPKSDFKRPMWEGIKCKGDIAKCIYADQEKQ